MSAGNQTETDLANLIFFQTALPAAWTPGTLNLALHTADPGEAGTQSTNEVSYTGYARVSLARSGAVWTAASGNIANVNAISFGQRTDAGSTVVTHWSLGLTNGQIVVSAPLSPATTIAQNSIPTFNAGILQTAID